MGIFIWIMDLFKRKRRVRHEYVSQKAIAKKESEPQHETDTAPSRQASYESSKPESLERPLENPDSPVIPREAPQTQLRRRRRQIESIALSENGQPPADSIEKETKTTGATNAETGEPLCTPASEDTNGETGNGYVRKDAVSTEVSDSEKAEEPEQATGEASTADEPSEADVVQIVLKENCEAGETGNTLAEEEAGEAKKNDAQEQQADIPSAEIKTAESQDIEQAGESLPDLPDTEEYTVEQDADCEGENVDTAPIPDMPIDEEPCSETQEEPAPDDAAREGGNVESTTIPDMPIVEELCSESQNEQTPKDAAREGGDVESTTIPDMPIVEELCSESQNEQTPEDAVCENENVESAPIPDMPIDEEPCSESQEELAPEDAVCEDENVESAPIPDMPIVEEPCSETQEEQAPESDAEARTENVAPDAKEEKLEVPSGNAESPCADAEESREQAITEKAERRERSVIRGNLLQEKQNVQRHVISEEEHLRKYILEQFSIQPLLGSIYISKTEFEYLLMPWFRKRAQNILYGNGTLNRNDPVFCVCLVQIAMRDSKHGEFWNHVAKRLGYSNPTQALMSRFGEIFIHTMKAHQKTVFDSGEKVASILMHCFVCDHHIPKLFDFLYAYYELDLFRQLELADVRKLRDIMVSGKYYTRKQLILQQTIDVLTYLPELGIERLERYLSWIDKAYFDESYQPEGAGRFVEAFKTWKENHPDFSTKQREKSSKTRKGRWMFSSPELCLNLRNGKFSVVFPKQKIPSDCNEAHWELVTSICGVMRVECEVIEAITSNLTGEIEIGFPSAALLGSIQFRLLSDTNVLRVFEIGQDCCRAFDDNGCLIRKKHLVAGCAYCFTHKGEQLRTQAPCTQQQTDDWLMSRYSFETGMTIEYPDGSIAIVGGEMAEGLCGGMLVRHARVLDEQKRPLPVYGRLPMLMIKTTQEKFKSGRMNLNSRYHPLEQLSYQRMELGDRSDEFGFLIAIPEEQHLIYDIAIDIAAEQDVRRYRFAYMDGFGFRFENSGEPLPYLFTPKGSVTIFGNALLHGHDMEKHPNKNEFGFVLDAARQVLEFDVLGQENASLELNIPVVTYRFDQQEWRIQPPEEMWHTELPKQIEFRIPGMSLELSVDADADTGRQSVTYSRGQNDKTITCDLMPLRSWLGRELFRHDIDLTIDGNRRHFATVYARSAVISARLEGNYEKGVLHGVFDIVGKSRYVVSLFYGEKPIVEQILIENGEIKVEMPADVGLYKAVIYEVEEDEFGFSEQLYKIGEAECELIDPGNIEGKTFYIKQLLTLKHQEVNLPIAHKRYWINVLNRRKNEERKYNGEMRIVDMWGSRPPIPVVITVKKRTMIDRVQITFVNSSGEFPFLYDYLNKTIILNEDMALHKMEKHRRYERLDYGDLFRVIYM